jgi:hypothetical protein
MGQLFLFSVVELGRAAGFLLAIGGFHFKQLRWSSADRLDDCKLNQATAKSAVRLMHLAN